jgi:CTP synthase (UTP-ammonia lyase)
MKLALVGDYSPASVVAHRAIPRALDLINAGRSKKVAAEWIESSAWDARSRLPQSFDGIWATPGSPYRSMHGVLEAIRYAREAKVPFLGTCGGFQHALIEFARNVAGLTRADHAESNPTAEEPVITALPASLDGRSGLVRLAPGSRLAAAYGRAEAEAEYRCSFGLNPAYRRTLEAAGLLFTAEADDGTVRGAELPSHPFFVGTLFQPERAALRDEIPPIVQAFVQAMAGRTR